MADDQGQERTLPATPQRRQKAREKGQVLRSRELSSTAVLLGGAVLFVASGAKLYSQISGVMIAGLSPTPNDIFNTVAMLQHLAQLFWTVADALVPLLGVVMVGAMLGGVAVGGWSFSLNPIMPDWSRIDPIGGLKKVISSQGGGELLKTIIKAIVIVIASSIWLWVDRWKIVDLPRAPAYDAITQAGVLFARFFLYLAGTTIVVLVFDLPFQMQQYAKRLKMTHQEVREEMKETEGHPDVKRRIRQLQQERARHRMMAAVPDADVVITNPTRFAVALRYEPTHRGAPVVVAKGVNEVARRIREIAAENGVPLLESARLARALYRHVPLEAEVPSVLYKAIAQVLAYIYRLKTGDVAAELPEVEVPSDLVGKSRA